MLKPYVLSIYLTSLAQFTTEQGERGKLICRAGLSSFVGCSQTAKIVNEVVALCCMHTNACVLR